MIPESLLGQINRPTRAERLEALRNATKAALFPPMVSCRVNNHIHTSYSFSPYSPCAAVFAARLEGLCTAGIVDHDSIAGADEFIAAGRIVGLPVTVGIEARVSMAGTSCERLRTNNPDQAGLSYMVLHAVPHKNIPMVQAYFAPLREARNRRNRAMVARINQIAGLDLDFDRDVLPLSMAHDGGSVTERHLMQAVARRQSPGLPLPEEYDRIGRLKRDFIPEVYLDADEECPRFEEYVRFCAATGGILAYPYLGDVTSSVTGDKRARRFEDGRLESLFELLHRHGVGAVTYMPTRNTQQQIDRLRALCRRYGMMEICGEDINSPRQSFIIEKMADPQFADLIASAWALIKHENAGKVA